MSIYIPPITTSNITLGQMEEYVNSQLTKNLANYVEVSGGTITGNLDVNGIIEEDSLTTNTVLVSNANKKIVSSSITSTTLGYLDATSSIQTQLNSKTTLSGLTSGDFIKATGSNSLGNSSVLSESGTTLKISGSINYNTAQTYQQPVTRYYWSFTAGTSSASTKVTAIPYPSGVSASTMMSVSGCVYLSPGSYGYSDSFYPINTPGTVASFYSIAASDGLEIWTSSTWAIASPTLSTYQIWFESA